MIVGNVSKLDDCRKCI